MVTNSSDWSLNENIFGMSLEDLTHTISPLTNMAVNDFCDIKSDGREMIHIVPYEKLDTIVMGGDMLVFMTKTMKPFLCQPEILVKQRGWHTDLGCVINGHAFRYGPWADGNNVSRNRCDQLTTEPRYNRNDTRYDFVINVMRFVPNEPTVDLASRSEHIHLWSLMFNSFVFPPGDDWWKDRADFSTVDELSQIARSLVRKNILSDIKVTCVQWAYTILCLALNFPITESVLKDLKVWDDYIKNWTNVFNPPPNPAVPFGKLPFRPYTSLQILEAFSNIYANGSITSKQLIERFRPGLSPGQQDLPGLVLMPSIFFCESRYPSPGSSGDWKYIATAMHPDYLTS